MTSIEMTVDRTDAIRGLLRTMVREEPAVRRARFRKRLLTWAGTGVLVAGALGTAGAVVLNPAPVTEATVVHCLASPTKGVNGDFVEQQATLSTPNGNRMTHQQSLDLCRTVWANGAFDGLNVAGKPVVAAGTAPAELTMCVWADGSAAVVPGGGNACAEAGLAPVKRG